MVTSSRGCLTPKGHFGIDCLSPLWLRSWQMLTLGECWARGVEQSTSLQARLSSDSCQLETSPRPQQAVFTATQPRCLSHSCYHHCLFTLNYCFSPRAQTPSQVLPVRTSASAPAQLLRHAITCIQWGNLAKTHSHCHFFFLTRLSWDLIILWA